MTDPIDSLADEADNSASSAAKAKSTSSDTGLSKTASEEAKKRKPKKKKRRRESHPLFVFLNGMLSFAVFAAIVAGVAFYVGQRYLASPGPLAQEKSVVINRGDGVREIAQMLETEGVITNQYLFTAAVFIRDVQSDLKAGEYVFPASVSMAEALNLLAEGRVILHRVTIPEGWTSEMIVNRLREDPILTGDITEIPREGSLLPETYTFNRGTRRADIIRQMREAQEKLLAELWEKRDPELPLSTLEELVTLASIVEKETGQSDERGKVAGVFVNRLNRNMRLQSDPTIIYGIVGGKGRMDRPISRADINQVTAYNTYQIDGLPPTPIANPGEASLRAVANPEETTAIFFVADGTGGHAFSETYEEHNRNVAKWREIERQRRQEEQEQQ